jgi:hypothetical protein
VERDLDAIGLWTEKDYPRHSVLDLHHTWGDRAIWVLQDGGQKDMATLFPLISPLHPTYNICYIKEGSTLSTLGESKNCPLLWHGIWFDKPNQCDRWLMIIGWFFTYRILKDQLIIRTRMLSCLQLKGTVWFTSLALNKIWLNTTRKSQAKLERKTGVI